MAIEVAGIQDALANLHCTDPRTACAYNTVLEVLRAFDSDRNILQKLERCLFPGVLAAHSLCSQFQSASDFLQIQIQLVCENKSSCLILPKP